MSFTKLFSSITDSSMWNEPHTTRIVWITMLAMADRRGFVAASIPGLAHRSRVTIAEAEEALRCFLAPDPYSRTKDFDGRRVMAVDGGWCLITWEKHREVQDTERAKESKRRWAANRRRQVDAGLLPASTLDEVDESRDPRSGSASLSEEPDRSLAEPEQEKITAPVVVSPTPGVKRLTVDNLDGWEPKPELYARALELGLSRELVDERIAELRTGPVGGARGVFPSKRDAYVLQQLPKWRTWHETAQAAAVHRPGSTSGGPAGVRRGQAFRPVLEPTSKHVAFAKAHGIDLPAMVRELEQSDVIDQLGVKRALEMLGERMSLVVRKRKAAQVTQ